MSAELKSTFAPQPVTTRGQPVRLGSDAKGLKVVYGNGRNVIVRDLENPGDSWLYTEHTSAVTVARFSPSGYYCASADTSGTVRIWDTVNAEHVLKYEGRPLGGRVTDVAWDAESKRLIAVGEGKSRFGAAFMFDTGASVGEILGHSKVVNAVSLRPARPFRAATASDDATVNFYEGVPYKFRLSASGAHTRFVQDVRFSPDGELFATAGMDGKMYLFDGRSGERTAELSAAAGAHTGGVFALAWSRDGKRLISSSADMTAKLWDVAGGSVVHTWTFSDSPTIDDQQVGNLWGAEHIVSLDLAGSFNYVDARSARPTRVVRGHQRAITAFAGAHSGGVFFSGDYEGRVFKWADGESAPTPVAGTGHGAQVIQMALDQHTQSLATIGLDDSLREISVLGSSFSSDAAVKTGALPRAVACAGEYALVATDAEVLVRTRAAPDTVFAQIPLAGFEASAIAAREIAAGDLEVAVGGKDMRTRLFRLAVGPDAPALTLEATLEGSKGAVSCLAYSPDGTRLAIADAARQINVFDTASRELVLHQWCFHTARVTCIEWAPDGQHAASGSLDTNIYVWSVAKPMKHIAIRNAHQEGVSGITWLDGATLASSGLDATLKTWRVFFP